MTRLYYSYLHSSALYALVDSDLYQDAFDIFPSAAVMPFEFWLITLETHASQTKPKSLINDLLTL
jgi:hypothetical protein